LPLDGLVLDFFGAGDSNDVIEDTEATEDEKLELELELDGPDDMKGGPYVSHVKTWEDGETPSAVVGGVSALILVFPGFLALVFQPLLVFVIVCPFTLLVIVSFTTCSVVR
jgi:hypothetical protein